MSTDLSVSLENRPGTLATLGETLGKAGINIQGVCGMVAAGRGDVHILVEDAAAARRALQAAGITVTAERPVLAVKFEDRPGELGRMARKIAQAGVNTDLLYLTTDGRVVIGADDLEKARAAL